MEEFNLITARQAADRLGIKLDTLYAYVSRGRLQSVSLPGTRERRYRVEDIEALLATREGDRPARSTEAEVLMPVIGSSICLIENGRLFYRGKDAIRLSEDATLEDIATLLWRAEEGADLDDDRPHAFPGDISASGLIERCQINLAAVADEDLPAVDLTRTGVIRTGWRILRVLTASVALLPSLPEPVHRRLAAAWRLDQAGAEILRRCLVPMPITNSTHRPLSRAASPRPGQPPTPWCRRRSAPFPAGVMVEPRPAPRHCSRNLPEAAMR